jgi:hypothetical protein
MPDWLAIMLLADRQPVAELQMVLFVARALREPVAETAPSNACGRVSRGVSMSFCFVGAELGGASSPVCLPLQTDIPAPGLPAGERAISA